MRRRCGNTVESKMTESTWSGHGSFTRSFIHGSRVMAICLFAVGLALAVGCGRSTGPAVEFVEGVVLLDGQPIEGADVGFSPVAGSLAAYGRTDSAGQFRLTTGQGGKRLAGAPIGDYAVTVIKWRNRLEDLGPRPDEADAKALAEWLAQEKAIGDMPPEYIVPKAYGDKVTSGLKATVKSGRNVGPEFRYELKGDFTGK